MTAIYPILKQYPSFLLPLNRTRTTTAMQTYIGHSIIVQRKMYGNCKLGGVVWDVLYWPLASVRYQNCLNDIDYE